MAEPVLACRREEFELGERWLSARAVWRQRCSLQLRIRDASGQVGLGEAAPLPGYSPDTPEGVEQALRALSTAQLQWLTELTEPAAVLSAVASLVPTELPAARFALEMALLDLLSRRLGLPLWATLRDPPFTSEPGGARAVPLCWLLSGAQPEAALSEAQLQFEQGVRCFKLKIGPGRLLPAQAELLALLRAQLGDQIELRLDANQSLERSELGATFASLARYHPAFVEEPVLEPQPAELASLACGWALDESLQRLDASRVAALCELPGCRALVLKPTALGGFGRCAELAALARACSRAVVVSHTLEGTLGWLACAHLACALGPHSAAGLWPPAQRTPASLRVAAGHLWPPREPGLGVAP